MGFGFQGQGHLPEILASFTGDELATWPSVLSKGEVERRRVGQHR